MLDPHHTPDDEKAVKKIIDKPVYRLKTGDELRIKHMLYVVTKVMSGGRAMIKCKS